MTTPPPMYVACVAAYNAGRLHGAWTNADQSADAAGMARLPVSRCAITATRSGVRLACTWRHGAGTLTLSSVLLRFGHVEGR
jgi:hypothetical protein